jgi:hypothetical protein
MYIDKSTGGFEKRIVIDWDDGAKTVITKGIINLHGRDGNNYSISQKSEHENICREILKENGYLIR